MEVDVYPLTWPQGYPRTPPAQRRRDYFKVTGDVARWSLQHELKLLGGTEIIISTNIKLVRGSELPFAFKEHTDPGVAVYFLRKGKAYSLACDSYRSVLANLRALDGTVKALRTIERHGGSTLLERAFTGFAALPPAGGEHRPWHIVLEVPVNASVEQIKDAHRALARRFHPDVGGDPIEFARINRAYTEAMHAPGPGGYGAATRTTEGD